jgi:hypothetical protein
MDIEIPMGCRVRHWTNCSTQGTFQGFKEMDGTITEGWATIQWDDRETRYRLPREDLHYEIDGVWQDVFKLERPKGYQDIPPRNC